MISLALIDAAETVVLANAGDALRLLGAPGWPLRKWRGQLSVLPESAAPLVRLPVSGAGYVLPASGGQVVFGATSQLDDDDGSVRVSDHAHNLAQLALLTATQSNLDPVALQGRTAWRWACSDRLPIVGAVPGLQTPWMVAGTTASPRADQPRHIPRAAGLYVFIALGSRGIAWSALGAQVLASCISGAPVPLEASLLDAIDPARFQARVARRAAPRS